MKSITKISLKQALIGLSILTISLTTFSASFLISKSNNKRQNAFESIAQLEENKAQSENENITPASSVSPTITSDASMPTITTKPITTPQPKPLSTNFEIGGWLPSFDFADGYNSLNTYKNKVNTVHYAGLSLTATGDLNFAKSFDNDLGKINVTGKKFGINIISSSYDGTAAFITDNGKTKALHDKVSELKQKYSNFNSVNIDFEQIRFSNRDEYINFLTDLKEFTKSKDLLLYVTSYAKTNDWMGNNTLDSQDYKKIGEIADYLVIMAYDYIHYVDKRESYAQANSPDFWVDAILAYATKRVDKNKIILALPLYGYGFDKTSGKKINAYVYSQIQSITKSENLITEQFNKEFGEMYIDRSNNMRIYFQNKDTVNIKKGIAEKYGINKIFYWRFGDDGGIGF